MAFDPDDPRPTYVQMADDLRHAIADGTYATGDRLPAVRTLAEQYGIANATAAKAVEVLRQAGIVTSRPGTGTVVRDATAAAAPSLQDQVDELRKRVETLEARG